MYTHTQKHARACARRASLLSESFCEDPCSFIRRVPPPHHSIDWGEEDRSNSGLGPHGLSWTSCVHGVVLIVLTTTAFGSIIPHARAGCCAVLRLDRVAAWRGDRYEFRFVGAAGLPARGTLYDCIRREHNTRHVLVVASFPLYSGAEEGGGSRPFANSKKKKNTDRPKSASRRRRRYSV